MTASIGFSFCVAFWLPFEMPHKRSKEEHERRYIKKQEKFKILNTFVAYTKVSKERYLPPEREHYISFPFIVRDLYFI